MKVEVFQKFLELAKLAQQEKVLDEFFEFMLTPQEYEQFQKRYALVEALIKDELPQREISKVLQVSIAKITRGSNALKIINPKLKKVLENFFTKA